MSLENRIAELEKQLNDLQSSSTSLPEGSTADQAVIDAAVKSAVSARESELRAEHARALQEARSTDVKMEPSDGSVETQRAELESSFAKRVDDAVAEKKAEMDKEIAELKGQIETLQQKIKVLERNVKTAEISRKTLEAKLKKYEAEATTPAAAAPATPGLSADAAAIKPGESSSPAAGSTTTDAKASPGSIRGRGRAVRGTGRGAKASAVLNGKPSGCSVSHALTSFSCQRYACPVHSIPNPYQPVFIRHQTTCARGGRNRRGVKYRWRIFHSQSDRPSWRCFWSSSYRDKTAEATSWSRVSSGSGFDSGG